jgi:CHAT domain-containing protein
LLRDSTIAYLSKLEPEQAQRMAAVLGNLSAFIRRFPLGNQASNIEIAITGYRVVAKVFSYQAFPVEWAKLQTNLGNAYSYRILGERAENLEEAIQCYFAALEVYTHKAMFKDLAMVLNNLGIAYLNRIRGERGQNLEEAIGCHLAASGIYTRKAFPQKWATTQILLGNAYLYRIRGETEKNLEAAIRSYRAALKVLTPEGFPQDWADTQNNLGEAYRNRIRRQRVNNLEVAIRCYRAALEIRTREAFPEDWADTQNNLGNAYLDRIRGNRPENLEAAIGCYKAALEVRTCQAFPQKQMETQFNIGIAYKDARRFRDAYDAFAAAIDTLESLRYEIVYGSGIEEDKQKLAGEWNKLYQVMVMVCLKLGYYDQAIEYVERSKTRNLVELILTRDLRSIFPPKIASQLEQIQDKIAIGQYQLRSATANNPTALTQHLQRLRQQHNKLQDSYLPIGYGFKFDQFQATINDHTAIIEWYITSAGFETFIVTRDSLQRLILPAPVDELNNFIDWVKDYQEAYAQKKTEWMNSLVPRLGRLSKILHLEDILKLVPDTCSRLILIPHRYLHLFPLHALPLTKGDFLCDRFPNGVGYAPSCQLLQLAQNREQHRHHFSHLLALENPTRSDLSPLAGTKLQLEQICQHFDSDNSIILREQEATEAALLKEQMRSPHCVHFCCHGSFNFGSPLKSALHLADPESKLGTDADLTLGKIFEKLNLEQCRLVTFSACETGIADPTSISDEYISLVSGFLYAGSPSVISTLWAVQQAATNLFMIEFYKNLKQLLPLKPGSVAIALNKTQKWLRTLTGEELGKIIESPEFQRHFVDVPKNPENKLFKESLEAAKRKPFPYQNPYYWAAFVATGL